MTEVDIELLGQLKMIKWVKNCRKLSKIIKQSLLPFLEHTKTFQSVFSSRADIHHLKTIVNSYSSESVHYHIGLFKVVTGASQTKKSGPLYPLTDLFRTFGPTAYMGRKCPTAKTKVDMWEHTAACKSS